MRGMRSVLPVAMLMLALLAPTMLAGCMGREASQGKAPTPLDASRQALVVRSDAWTATSGVLQAYERSWTGTWKAVGAPVPVLLGRSGLGWGLGLHPEQAGEPAKHEGDGRAPAGLFALPGAFGYEPLAPPVTAFPFQVLTAETVCVDDEVSARYNTVFEASAAVPRDWDSFETMRRKDQRYSLGVLVAHNAAPVRPGAGSCIFLHVQSEPPAPTSGCTAMAKPDLERLIRWLDAAKKPVLVQLPQAEYQRFQAEWGLP